MKTMTRKELMVVDESHGGYLAGHCALCGDPGWIDMIEHEPGCLLADATVTHVRMTACCARIVISGPRNSDGKLHWTSGSGTRYDIERRGRGRDTHYVMSARCSGKSICDNSRLRDIRQFIKDNQGRL